MNIYKKIDKIDSMKGWVLKLVAVSFQTKLSLFTNYVTEYNFDIVAIMNCQYVN